MTSGLDGTGMSSELDRAFDYCQRVAKDRAKNFYYAFRTLPSQKRRAIYAAYAFCRYCDDVADDELPIEEKRRLLGETHDRLHDSGLRAEDPVFMALDSSAETFGIPQRYFDEIIEGVEMDLTWTRFENFDQLRTYCYGVASTVGLICIEVFGYDDPAAREYAIDLGIAMQLTNVMRDVKEDAERGRIYLPLDEIESFGYSEDELLDGQVNDRFRALMAFQADRARRYFDSGGRLIPLLSRESRACVSVLHGLYSKILDRIGAADYDVFERRIGLSKREKLFLTARLWAASLITAVPTAKR
jgi:phytoene synthase